MSKHAAERVDKAKAQNKRIKAYTALFQAIAETLIALALVIALL